MSLIRLSPQESRNVELILFRYGYAQAPACRAGRDPVVPRVWRILRPVLAAILVAFLAAAGLPGSRSAPAGNPGADRGRGTAPLRLMLAAAQPHRCQTLQQRHPPLFRMVLGKLAPPGTNLILRRDRQLIDARHPRASRHAFRLRRNESFRFMQLRSGPPAAGR